MSEGRGRGGGGIYTIRVMFLSRRDTPDARTRVRVINHTHVSPPPHPPRGRVMTGEEVGCVLEMTHAQLMVHSLRGKERCDISRGSSVNSRPRRVFASFSGSRCHDCYCSKTKCKTDKLKCRFVTESGKNMIIHFGQNLLNYNLANLFKFRIFLF